MGIRYKKSIDHNKIFIIFYALSVSLLNNIFRKTLLIQWSLVQDENDDSVLTVLPKYEFYYHRLLEPGSSDYKPSIFQRINVFQVHGRAYTIEWIQFYELLHTG